tara:strand:- start:2096 stop:2311 length:216 start_codon:yes stop_codon:yes gene_type:complete
MDSQGKDTKKNKPTKKKKIKRKVNKAKRIEEYIATFDELEMKAYQIAKEFLETSFDIEKSIGYQEWIKSRK